MSVTKQGSSVLASMVDAGTTAASPDFSRPPFLSSFTQPRRRRTIGFLSYSSGWDKDPFTLQLLLFLPFLGASDGPPVDLGLSPRRWSRL